MVMISWTLPLDMLKDNFRAKNSLGSDVVKILAMFSFLQIKHEDNVYQQA
jgi:hypothetical protein